MSSDTAWPRPTQRTPLLRDDWSYVEGTSLEAFGAADWERMNAQRAAYNAEEIARQALRLLSVSRDDTTFGYQVNNFRHSVQTATLMLADGLDEESVVLGLLHDVGFTLCPERHAEFAAELIGPYLGERNEWVLRMHPIFQQKHIHGYPGLDENARDAYRGHPHFEAAARFVERYDIVSIRAGAEEAPLEFFEPMVHRFFQRPRRW